MSEYNSTANGVVSGFVEMDILADVSARIQDRIPERIPLDPFAELEDIVGDGELATAEVGKSVSDSLGHVSVLASEAAARRVAHAVAPVVLDQTNWTEA
jgi:hypothetical protein